jgi:hypothetical protein
MPSYSYAETKEIVNGKIVKDTAIKTEYDGKKLHIDKFENGKKYHALINDNELKKILAKPTNKMDLLKRLKKLYTKRKYHNKKHHHKKTKRETKRHKKRA